MKNIYSWTVATKIIALYQWGIDATIGAVDGLNARLESEADESIVVRVPSLAIDDFTWSAAAEEPLRAQTVGTDFL